MDQFVIVKTHLTHEEFDEVKKGLGCANIAVASQAVGGARGQNYSSLLVHRDMYKKALKMSDDILKEFRNRPKWTLKTCIDCDSTNFARVKRGLFKELFSIKNLYQCSDCGCSWEMKQ